MNVSHSSDSRRDDNSCWIAGVDGFKGRWFAVLRSSQTGEVRCRIVESFAGLLVFPERPRIVCVDIPIGLREFAGAGGRTCESAARRVLKRRASSVFSADGRTPLKEATRIDADRVSRANEGLGIGAQAWGLAVKLREADEAMSPEIQQIVREVHPEVIFWAMNECKPMQFSKRTPQGARERMDVLIRNGFDQSFIENLGLPVRVPADDFLDACAALWTAERIHAGAAGRMPIHPKPDERGLDQAIWF